MTCLVKHQHYAVNLDFFDENACSAGWVTLCAEHSTIQIRRFSREIQALAGL